ncbi:MAG: hypothetical protein Q7T60_17215 [Sphingopyxis sp.]|nr:hypothetical protein [Sphingopyxis sp.]
MAFQITPLQLRSLTPDFSAENSAFAKLGETLGNLPADIRKQQAETAKRDLLATAAQGGDLNKIGLAMLGSGDVQGGAALLGLGQKAKERQDQIDYYKNSPFGGGGGTPLGGAPTGASTGPTSLIQNESGGNWQAQNNATGAGGLKGHFGRLQFGQARIQEAAAAGAIPEGTTPQAFMQSPELQQRAEAWHWSDIDNHIKQTGLDRAIGQTINGVPVTAEGMRAVAHLGGKEGLSKFIASGGRYNPADENGTRLSDYFARHGGGGGPQVASSNGGARQPAGVQVAENEADVQRLEAQSPGYGGASAVASVAGDDPIKLRQEAARYQQTNPEAARQFLARADAAERGVQTAQAPAQPGPPIADLPAQGAAPAQGFAIPQGQSASIPPNDPYPKVSTQSLLDVMRNPRAPEGEREIAKQLFTARQAYSAENAPDKREQSRLQTEKLRREVEGEGARPMTPQERTAYSVPDGQPAYMNRQGEPKFGPASTKITNSIGATEGEYAKANGKAISGRFEKIVEEGDNAQAEAGVLSQLRSLGGQIKNMGSGAALQAKLADYGIKVGENVSEIEAYGALIDKLTPQQKIAGAGATSDFDARMFKSSLPGLMRTPGGNEIILGTLEALNTYKRQRADVVAEAMAANEKPADVLKRLKELPDPFSGFKESRKTAGPGGASAPPPSADGWTDMGGGVRIRQK